MSRSTTCADASLPANQGMTVLYDGACPLCRREIAVYQNLSATAPLAFADVSDPQLALPPDRQRAELLARFHVQLADGTLVSGAAAFVALWARLPGWRWLARLAQLPGMLWLMERAYVGFLRWRPAIQRVVRAWDTAHLPADMVGDLRSDQAGETGAVWIYRGIRAVSRNAELRAFAERHGATESDHLRQVNDWLPPLRRSVLLPAWRVAGFLTGALPALAGPRAVYATIAAVETFVDVHYQAQIDRLADRAGVDDLRALLVACQGDERAHRDEAAALVSPPAGALLRAWCAVVGRGSSMAVVLARRV